MADPTQASAEMPFEEIPLPEGVELEALAGLDETPAPATATPTRAAEVERLSFVQGRPRSQSIDLDHPFLREGEIVDRVTVRRLTTWEVSVMAERLPVAFDNFDIYAAMTGLPAAVLRGLDEADGHRVTLAAFDFLPRAFRPDGS